MKDSLGVIFGETNLREFRFLASSREFTEGDYVRVDDPETILAQVSRIMKLSDLDLDAAEQISAGKSLKVKSRVVARAKILGTLRGSKLVPPRNPPSPGSLVYPAQDELVSKLLDLSRGGAYLGLLYNRGIRVELDPFQLISKHCCILAKTGGGKSYAAGVIVEELLEAGFPVLIIDPHGEYHVLRNPNPNPDPRYGIEPKGYRIAVFTPSNFSVCPEADHLLRLDGIGLSPDHISEFLNLGSSQLELIYDACEKLRSRNPFYTLDQLISQIRSSSRKAKWKLISMLESLVQSGIFSDNPTTLDQLFQPGTASIIDFKGVAPQYQDAIAARILTQLFESRKLGKIPQGMVVIEEAHRFCPERGYGKSAASGIIRTIASEGRKFGLGLMVISQRPAKIDKNVISQCGTQLILRITNPNDLKAIAAGIDGISEDELNQIKGLPVGTGLVISTQLPRPIFVQIRSRRSGS